MDLHEIQTLVSRGHYLRALRAARSVAHDPSHPAAERIDALLIACRCAAERGQYVESYAFADRALALAEEAGEKVKTALARLHAGQARLKAGNPVDAEEHLLAFLAAMPAVPDLEPYRAVALYGLGLCYAHTRRFEAALATYRQAVHLFEACGEYARAIKARHNIAWHLLRQGQTDEAEAELLSARRLFSHATSFDRANQIVLEAFAAYRRGNPDEALAGAEEILTPGCPGVTAWSRCLAAWIACSISLETCPEYADILLQAALQEMEQTRDTALMNMINELRYQVQAL